MENFKVITSKENSLIKLVSLLQTSAKARKENGLFVLEGLRICDDAFENGIWFDKLIISESAENKFSDFILKFCKNSNEIYKIPDRLFDKISDTATPQGICAVCAVNEVSTNKISENGRYIALENIADPSNLGAISRTAEALGVSGLILSANGCDPYSPKALRASMGTLLRMPVIVLNDFVGEIKKSGLYLYACVVDRDADLITEKNFSDGCAVIIGNEANGLTENMKSIADERITIPMKGKAESLNAAVAASISIWEMMR